MLCAGEKEMANGTVDIRTREDGKLGQVRVDEFAEKLKEEMPKKSQSYNNFYSKVWKAENFGLEPKAVQGMPSSSGPSLASQPNYVDIQYVGAP